MNDANGPAQRLWLKAYAIGSTEGWVIEPAPSKRDWMDDTYKKIAYRCLPLIAANMAGWVVRCPATFTAVWNGKHGQSRRGDPVAPAAFPAAHRGGGALAFRQRRSYLLLSRGSSARRLALRLLLRGLANHVKADAVPLDAVIETDWSPYTFTMNWKMVRGARARRVQEGRPGLHGATVSARAARASRLLVRAVRGCAPRNPPGLSRLRQSALVEHRCRAAGSIRDAARLLRGPLSGWITGTLSGGRRRFVLGSELSDPASRARGTGWAFASNDV